MPQAMQPAPPLPATPNPQLGAPVPAIPVYYPAAYTGAPPRTNPNISVQRPDSPLKIPPPIMPDAVYSGPGAPVIEQPKPKKVPFVQAYSAAQIAAAKKRAGGGKKRGSGKKTAIAFIFFFILIGAIIAFFYFVAPGSGPMAPDDPIQITAVSDPIMVGNATLTPQATYDITAKILSITSYEMQENGDIIPYDIALGWGDMSNMTYVSKINVSQHGRWYYWSFTGDIGLDPQYVSTHSANTHIIPANRNLLTQIRSLRRGHTIRMTGYLVDIMRVEESRIVKIETSLTRNDTGAGACEIMYVETLEKL